MDTPCSACTESVMCTSRPRYRPLECIVPVCSHSYGYMLDMRQLGGTTESIMAFSSQIGMERFFYCPVIKEEQTMSVEVELEESVSYTPLQRMRHSAAHVMAEAVLEIFPDAKLAIGPAIEDGFYYDFDLPRALTPDDLPEIERRMTRIIAGKYPFLQERWPREKALEYFRDRGQIYKVELIENLPDEEVGIYRQHNFLDLCRGPHVEHTGEIGPFKLMKIAGAYWRGDEHRPMLQRIYGTAWFTQEELDHYLWRLDEARKRDHRTLGKSLDLYSTSEAVGPGLILWHPRGATVRFLAERFSQEALVRRKISKSQRRPSRKRLLPRRSCRSKQSRCP